MTQIETIPVYNRKGKRITSLKIEDFNVISSFDDTFFEVTGDFVLVKPKFFRAPHIIKPQRLWIQGTRVTMEPKEKLDYKRVLFLIDTPHKNEFNYVDDFKAGAPLSARSFDSFTKTFHKLMNKISEKKGEAYEVVFYTMVPFQTSLHFLLGKSVSELTRFNFWFYGWSDLKYQKDFEVLMEDSNFDFYINAGKRMFKNFISKELSRFVNKEYQVTHPANRMWKQKELRVGIREIIHLNDKDIFGTL